MIAFLIDPHLRFKNNPPIGRTNSYYSDIYDKLEDLADQLVSREIKYLILSGDILDIKQPSRYNFRNIQDIKAYFDMFKNKGIQVYSIYGNHDKDPKDNESVYDFLHKYLKCFEDISNKTITIGDCTIEGIPYNTEVEEVKQKILDSNADIVVCHEHLVPDNYNLPDQVHRIYYSDLSNTKAQFIVAGHLHEEIPLTTINNTTIANPPSLSRMHRNTYTLSGNHIPSYYILGEDKYTPLKCKPLKDVIIEDISKTLVKQQQRLQINFESVSTSKELDLSFLPKESLELIDTYLEKD